MKIADHPKSVRRLKATRARRVLVVLLGAVLVLAVPQFAFAAADPMQSSLAALSGMVSKVDVNGSGLAITDKAGHVTKVNVDVNSLSSRVLSPGKDPLVNLVKYGALAAIVLRLVIMLNHAITGILGAPRRRALAMRPAEVSVRARD